MPPCNTAQPCHALRTRSEGLTYVRRDISSALQQGDWRRAAAALLGRFLPRLGPLGKPGGLFSLEMARALQRRTKAGSRATAAALCLTSAYAPVPTVTAARTVPRTIERPIIVAPPLPPMAVPRPLMGAPPGVPDLV